jgi:hypothetical protein
MVNPTIARPSGQAAAAFVADNPLRRKQAIYPSEPGMFAAWSKRTFVPMGHPSPPSSTSSRPPDGTSTPSVTSTGLFAVLAFTFLNSLGTGLVTNGVFFLTTNYYKFTQAENYLVGVVMGLTYIVAAATAGRLVKRLQLAFPALSTRGVLTLLMFAMGAITLVPVLATNIIGTAGDFTSHGGDARPSAWPIWMVIVTYIPLTGILWPLTESYLSGGKSGPTLRRDTGIFNIVWSGSVLLAVFGLSPLIEHHAMKCFIALTVVHLGVGALLPIFFSPAPAPHLHGEHEPHPPVYNQLLITFRWLLPLAYVITSVLGPYLPSAMLALKVEPRHQPLIAGAWLLPRMLTFAAVRYTNGWHGSWAMPVLGTSLLIGGFTLAVLSPLGTRLNFSNDQCILLMIAGLFCFGVGNALIYAGALYYAMEVGAAEVDAGGTHEALIGVGYLVGPLCGLLPTLAVMNGWLSADNFQTAVLSMVAVIVAVVVLTVGGQVRRSRVRPM